MQITVFPMLVKTVRHIRMKVFDKNGAGEALNIEIPYSEGDKVKAVKAQTIDTNGKKHSVKHFAKKTVGAYRVISFTFPAVEDGAILEYQYMVTHERITFLDPWVFQNRLFTLESRFSVIPYAGLTYTASTHYVPERDKAPTSEDVIFMSNPATKYTWTLHNIAPIREEPYIGGELDYVVSLYFQLQEYRDQYQTVPFYKDWGYIGTILDNRLAGMRSKSEKTVQALSDSLCAGLENDNARIKSCYYYLRDNIETRDEEDERTFKEIIADGVGSSTGKNILLAELLHGQGLDAYPMMIGTRDQHVALDWKVSQLNMLNGVICSVADADSNHFGLDVNDRYSVYPYLPAALRVDRGLQVEEDSCGLITLIHPERKSGTDIMTALHVDLDGSAVCTTTVYINGYCREPCLKYVGDITDSSFWMEKAFTDPDVEYEIESAAVTSDSANDRIICEFVIHLEDVCENIDGNYILTPFVLKSFDNPFTSQRRNFAIDFQYPFADRTRLLIALPDNMVVRELPNSVEHSSYGLTYNRSTVAKDNIIRIKEELDVTKPLFLPNEYGVLKGVFDAVQAFNYEQIVFGEAPANGGK